MLAEIGQPQRLGVDDEPTEDAVPFGEVTDEPVRVVVDPDGDELRQAGAGLVEHAERAVAGIDQPDRRLDDPPKHARRIEVRAEGEHRVEELAKAARTGHLGHAVNTTRAARRRPSPIRRARMGR